MPDSQRYVNWEEGLVSRRIFFDHNDVNAFLVILPWPHNAFDNNVSRISGNVVRRFLDDTPFSMPD
jgi:hypothetical protein